VTFDFSCPFEAPPAFDIFAPRRAETPPKPRPRLTAG
jgi:hypothetical protein